MGEFNPTAENILDLETSILEHKRKKAEIVAQKVVKQLEAGKIKDILNDPKIADKLFNETIPKRVLIKQELSDIELSIKKINLTISGKRQLLLSVQSHVKIESSKGDSEQIMIQRLKKLKDKYQNFSSDHTRISSMRVMSSLLVEELEDILKEAT